MSQDQGTSEEEVELTTSSEETQNDSVEDNSHSEAQKNQSNFKKLARERKRLKLENERLRAQLASSKQTEEADDDSFEDDENLDGLDSTEPFSDIRSELWFVKNKGAEEYREKMAELVEDNPSRAKLPLSDLLDLAKARFPKSTSKKTFDISSVRSTSSKEDVAKIDTSKMSEEEIMALPPDVYKKLFMKK